MPPKSSADELFSALTRIGGDTGWYAVAPFHRIVFPGLLRGIVEDAERNVREARG